MKEFHWLCFEGKKWKFAALLSGFYPFTEKPTHFLIMKFRKLSVYSLLMEPFTALSKSFMGLEHCYRQTTSFCFFQTRHKNDILGVQATLSLLLTLSTRQNVLLLLSGVKIRPKRKWNYFLCRTR